MKTFFFYDLETSGLNTRTARVMQFAGQRTDENLAPLGEAVNFLVKLPDDILPDPEAILTTRITPQMTQRDGIAEAEFAKLFAQEIATPGTIFVGYNNVRYDDEVMRNVLWRNFFDPYKWAWQDDRSRWDILDVGRMVRALRPDGIKWPVNEEGFATNALEMIGRENNLKIAHAHDAMSDVETTIEFAKLIKKKQPKMWDYLLAMREKKSVVKLVSSGKPFVYTSGRYRAEFAKTTIAIQIAAGENGKLLVADLRENPTFLEKMSTEKIAEFIWPTDEIRERSDFREIPVKEFAANRCPAIAPLGTVDQKTAARLKIDLAKIEKHAEFWRKNPGIGDKIADAFSLLQKKTCEKYSAATKQKDVEEKLYDSFLPDGDRAKIRAISQFSANELADFQPNFVDERLPELLLRYKARNFPQSLSESEKNSWEKFKTKKFAREIQPFLEKLSWCEMIRNDITPAEFSQENAAKTERARAFSKLKNRFPREKMDEFLLEEMKLWAESIAPDSE